MLAFGPFWFGVQYSTLMLKVPVKFCSFGLTGAGSRYVAALANDVTAYPSGRGKGNGGMTWVTFAMGTFTKKDLQLYAGAARTCVINTTKASRPRSRWFITVMLPCKLSLSKRSISSVSWDNHSTL